VGSGGGGLRRPEPGLPTAQDKPRAAFLEPERLADVLRGLGLSRVEVRRLALGSVAIVAGTRN
jgi:hypothetical protein